MPEDTPENDPLQLLIAEFLDAESRGESIDREDFLRKHPEHENSLRAFFANHDAMKSNSDSDGATIPPGLTDNTTLPPTALTREGSTLPPSDKLTLTF